MLSFPDLPLAQAPKGPILRSPRTTFPFLPSPAPSLPIFPPLLPLQPLSLFLCPYPLCPRSVNLPHQAETITDLSLDRRWVAISLLFFPSSLSHRFHHSSFPNKDVATWLKALRLHKYTGIFEAMTWEKLVNLSDEDLQDLGISALGARRKILKEFETLRETGYPPRA